MQSSVRRRIRSTTENNMVQPPNLINSGQTITLQPTNINPTHPNLRGQSKRHEEG